MSVDDSYRLVALGYDPATALFLDPIRRLVRDTATRLGARRVLDACCGTGRQTLALRRAGLRALGVDASPAMLAVARKAAGKNAPFARMDARRLAFADATFDAACIILALHENAEPDRLAMVREMARVTRPGGSLLLVDYTAATTGGMAGLLVPLAERLAGAEHYRNYRDFMLRKGVAGLCRRLGLAPAGPLVPCLLGRAALLTARV
ncbi:class I SAM-dependent methyltransferase [Solidesulfovibrio sp. C21]|uniref:class I SAM-dependent methyltransferase n=1 Tax=Solidesulfovibrio sp. C21 TaxID=3398613 RepID=UPI0039FC760E